MESYSEQLERECKELEHSFPILPKIIDEIIRIKNKSEFEFDYSIERRHLMLINLKNILIESKLIKF